MKNYSHLVYKQIWVNKRRSIYTIIGIIIGIILLITIAELHKFMGEISIQHSKEFRGDYEAYFSKLSKKQENLLKGNVNIKDVSFSALESLNKISINGKERDVFVYALDNNSFERTFHRKIKIFEGNVPKSKDEIILDYNIKKQLNKNVGNIIEIGNSKYKIVGFYKNKNMNSGTIEAIKYFDESENYSNLLGFINIKDNSNKVETIMKIANDIGVTKGQLDIMDYRINFNEEILNQYGYTVPGTNYNDFSRVVINIYYILILIAIVLLTYSSLNVSTKERIQYLGLLRCIGITPDKIRILLLKEGLILGLLSILPGLIIGHFIAWIIVNVGLAKFAHMNFYGVSFKIYWGIMGLAIAITILAIILSSIILVIKASKIPPIEAIKPLGTNDNSNKLRKSKIIRKLFGYKGELAYKNIRANNRSFIIITITLTVTLISFVLSTGYFSSMIKGIKDERIVNERNFEVDLNTPNYMMNSDNDNITIIDNNFKILSNTVNFIKNTGNATDIFSYLEFNMNEYFNNKNSLNTDVKEAQGSPIISNKKYLFIYSDESLKEIMPYIKGDNVNIDSFKENGVVLVNTTMMNGLRINERNGEFANISSSLNMKLVGTINNKHIPFGDRLDYDDGIFIIASKDFYDKNKKEILSASTSNSFMNIYFNFLDLSKREETKELIEQYVSEYEGLCIDNYLDSVEDIRYLLGVSVVFYTILFLITLIGATNIINNRSISISLRKKEFGTLLAMGMDKRDLRSVILLEGIVQWLISVLIGGVISYIGLEIILLILWKSGQINEISMPVWILVVGIFLLLIINLASSIIPFRRFKNFDTIEMMRSEE